MKGVINKGRELFAPIALLNKDPQPCFASKKAKEKYYQENRTQNFTIQQKSEKACQEKVSEKQFS